MVSCKNFHTKFWIFCFYILFLASTSSYGQSSLFGGSQGGTTKLSRMSVVNTCDNFATNYPLCNQCAAGAIFNGGTYCQLSPCPNGGINPPLCTQCSPGYQFTPGLIGGGGRCIPVPTPTPTPDPGLNEVTPSCKVQFGAITNGTVAFSWTTTAATGATYSCVGGTNVQGVIQSYHVASGTSPAVAIGNGLDCQLIVASTTGNTSTCAAHIETTLPSCTLNISNQPYAGGCNLNYSWTTLNAVSGVANCWDSATGGNQFVEGLQLGSNQFPEGGVGGAYSTASPKTVRCSLTVANSAGQISTCTNYAQCNPTTLQKPICSFQYPADGVVSWNCFSRNGGTTALYRRCMNNGSVISPYGIVPSVDTVGGVPSGTSCEMYVEDSLGTSEVYLIGPTK